jgi:hypothetical protein
LIENFLEEEKREREPGTEGQRKTVMYGDKLPWAREQNK